MASKTRGSAIGGSLHPDGILFLHSINGDVAGAENLRLVFWHQASAVSINGFCYTMSDAPKSVTTVFGSPGLLHRDTTQLTG